MAQTNGPHPSPLLSARDLLGDAPALPLTPPARVASIVAHAGLCLCGVTYEACYRQSGIDGDSSAHDAHVARCCECGTENRADLTADCSGCGESLARPCRDCSRPYLDEQLSDWRCEDCHASHVQVVARDRRETEYEDAAARARCAEILNARTGK